MINILRFHGPQGTRRTVVPYEQRSPGTLLNSQPSTAFIMSISRRLHAYSGPTGSSCDTCLFPVDRLPKESSLLPSPHRRSPVAASPAGSAAVDSRTFHWKPCVTNFVSSPPPFGVERQAHTLSQFLLRSYRVLRNLSLRRE